MVLLAEDDVGKMLGSYGEESIGLDAVSAGIRVLRHFVEDERLMKKEERRGKARKWRSKGKYLYFCEDDDSLPLRSLQSILLICGVVFEFVKDKFSFTSRWNKKLIQ